MPQPRVGNRIMEYQLIYKNIKNINIHIKPPEGMVVVTAPYGVSSERIETVLREKEDWIRKSQEKMKDRSQARPPQREYSREDAEKLEQILRKLISFWETRTDLHPSLVRVHPMTSRWGSCNHRTRAVNFALQLVDQPEEFISYVVLHELCHIQVPNHGPAFKALLDRYMPNWRQVTKEQKNGRKALPEFSENEV